MGVGAKGINGHAGATSKLPAPHRSGSFPMQKPVVVLAISASLAGLSSAAPAATDAPVELDLLLRGGTVYTGDSDQPVVGDVGIAGDRIVFAGRKAPPQFSARRTIDAAGLVVA